VKAFPSLLSTSYEGSLDPITDWTEDIRKTVDVNVIGSIATFVEALKAFDKNPGKDHSIVLLSSIGMRREILGTREE
jgi:hypothetical protein